MGIVNVQQRIITLPVSDLKSLRYCLWGERLHRDVWPTISSTLHYNFSTLFLVTTYLQYLRTQTTRLRTSFNHFLYILRTTSVLILLREFLILIWEERIAAPAQWHPNRLSSRRTREGLWEKPIASLAMDWRPMPSLSAALEMSGERRVDDNDVNPEVLEHALESLEGKG